MAEAHILDRLRTVSDAYSRGDMGVGEARNTLKDFLRLEGFTPREAGLRNLASTARLNLILRQNASMAHAAGEWQRMHDPDQMAVFPYVRYHCRGDLRTRDSHSKLDGNIYRKDDPFLRTHTPPWEFNCRCWLEEITAQEAGRDDKHVQPPTPENDVRVDSESGFSFDPEHAFEEFDLSAIKDESFRNQVAEEMEERFSTSVSDDTAKMPHIEDEEQNAAGGKEIQKAAAPLKKFSKKVDFPDMPEAAAEDVSSASIRLANRLKEYNCRLAYVGTNFEKMNESILFETRISGGKTLVIFNKSQFTPDLQERLKRDAATKFHPSGCGTIESQIDHEVAHLIFEKVKDDPEFIRIATFLKRHPGMVKKYISGYALSFYKKDNFGNELFAECWAEYKNNPNAARIYKKIGGLLDKYIT